MNAENFNGYDIYALGDSAITIEFGKYINPETNDLVISRFKQFQENPIKGVLDLIPSYHSLTLCYDLNVVAKQKSGLHSLIDQVKLRLEEPIELHAHSTQLHEVPVVYGGKNGSDLLRVSQEKGIDLQEIIPWQHWNRRSPNRYLSVLFPRRLEHHRTYRLPSFRKWHAHSASG